MTRLAQLLAESERLSREADTRTQAIDDARRERAEAYQKQVKEAFEKGGNNVSPI